jgi:hypothetical protein
MFCFLLPPPELLVKVANQLAATLNDTDAITESVKRFWQMHWGNFRISSLLAGVQGGLGCLARKKTETEKLQGLMMQCTSRLVLHWYWH